MAASWCFLLLLTWGSASCSAFFTVCPLHLKNVLLKMNESVFLTTNNDVVTLRLEWCQKQKTGKLSFAKLGSYPDAQQIDNPDRRWLKLTLANEAQGIQPTLRVEGQVNYTILASSCPVRVGVPDDTVLGHACPNLDYILRNLEISTSDPHFGYNPLGGGSHSYETPSYSPSYRHHVIFIPVGAIVLLIILCSRLCCGRSAKRPLQVLAARRTVVGVVPPSAISMPPQPTAPDQPPAYADVEAPPPAYSSVAKQDGGAEANKQEQASDQQETSADKQGSATPQDVAANATSNDPELSTPPESSNVVPPLRRLVPTRPFRFNIPGRQFRFKPLNE